MESLIERLKKMRSKKGTSIDASDLDALLVEVVAALGSVSDQREMISEIEAIADKIRQAKADIYAISAEDTGQGQIKGANLELDEVIKATEDASNRIMDAAEKIQALCGGNAEISEQIGQIFEACSFQDITGQRICKVLGLLADVEKSIAHLMGIAKLHVKDVGSVTKMPINPKTQADEEKDLLNGPQLGKNTPSQDDIDKMFAEL
jgi:chemotaxis protein CheZ